MSEFDNRYIDGLGDEFGGRYQLDIDVNTLVFVHHLLTLLFNLFFVGYHVRI